MVSVAAKVKTRVYSQLWHVKTTLDITVEHLGKHGRRQNLFLKRDHEKISPVCTSARYVLSGRVISMFLVQITTKNIEISWSLNKNIPN